MNNRIRANIQVGANWHDFRQRCQLNGTSATEVLNNCINSYMANSETIANQAPQGYLEDRAREIVRQELPPSLKAVADSVRASLLSEIEQLKSELAQMRHLDQVSVEPTKSYSDSSNTMKNSQTKPFHKANNQPGNLIVSQLFCDTIDLVDKSEGEKEIQNLNSSPTEVNNSSQNQENLTFAPPISSRALAKILGVNGTTVSRNRIKWANGQKYDLALRHGYEPGDRGGWVQN